MRDSARRDPGVALPQGSPAPPSTSEWPQIISTISSHHQRYVDVGDAHAILDRAHASWTVAAPALSEARAEVIGVSGVEAASASWAFLDAREELRYKLG
jgi:hypothetical protein